MRQRWAGARAVLPVTPVIATLGLLLGYTARAAGLDPVAAATMSATTFAGGAQFAALAVFQGGGTLLAAAGTAAALNARYALMGATLASAMRGGALRRFLLAQLAVDESWAVAYTGDGQFSLDRLVGAGLLLLTVHVTTTAAGAMAGPLLDDPRALGLDAALPALFLLLLWPHLRKWEGARAALVGAGGALVLTPLLAAGVAVLGGALVGAMLGGSGREDAGAQRAGEADAR